jgi:4-amino-4-deoxy-L-arabinose transferase-like glycosyltransferase
MNCIQRFFDRLPEWKILMITAVFAVLMGFYCLSGRILLSGDETRVAGIIRELQFSPRPFFLPRLNGVPFLEYPPLYYWGGAFFLSAFGVSYGTVKAMSALSFCLSILLVYGLARRLKLDKATAFFSAVMLGSALAFFSTGRTCMVDITLGFFVLLAVFGFYSGMTATGWKSALCCYIVYAAGAGCAVMTKGLLGLALPGVILFFLLLVRDIAERRLHWKLWLILGFASLAALIPVAVWAYELYRWMGWNDFYEVMHANNIGRFSGSHIDHRAPFYYYLLRLPELFQPWLLLIPFGLWKACRDFRREHDHGSLFLLCAFLAPLALLSVASAKRNVYLIPVYPAAMILAGSGLGFLLDLLCRKAEEEKLLRTGRLAGLVLICLAAAAAVFLFFQYPGLRPWAVLPLLLAAAGLILFLRRDLPRGGLLLLLTLAALLPYGEAVLPNRFAAEDNLESLFRRVGELENQGEKVYLLDPMERLLGASAYYRGHLMAVRKRKDYDGRSREIWVLRKRDKKKTAPYGDHHYIVQMPEGKSL